MDSTYMFNIEGLIPKLSQLAQEVGDDERALGLRSAGLKALASMVLFMGEHSHISMDFDSIIYVILENYMDLQINPENGKQDGLYFQHQGQGVQEVLKAEDHGSSFPEISEKVSSLPNLICTKAELDPTMDTSKCPSYWSRVCLHNMAGLAKAATTVRRMLEPLFHNFDVGNHWSPKNGLAWSVLMYFQSLLEESGENSHLLLSVLVKHLEHKNVVKQPLMQISIVNLTTHLAHHVKQEASVAILGAISDLVKHLRKCLQSSAEAVNGMDKWRTDFQSALENCILQLSNKVGDVGPILDMMALLLENISSSAVVARTTISAVYRTAQIVSSNPNISYHKKAFPDALFYQLLVAMTHQDQESRVGAHHVFSAVFMPSLSHPSLCGKENLLETSSGFSSFTALLNARSGGFFIQDEFKDKVHINDETSQNLNSDSNPSFSVNPAKDDRKKGLASLRLSSNQMSLLLSSIWVQATSAEASSSNFEALAHTYSIALLSTQSKASCHMALVRCFQLAFSLRSLSLDQDGGLQPSHRRSLFTLASYMLLLLARASNLPELIPLVKPSLGNTTIDPHVELFEDTKRQAADLNFDEVFALNSLSTIKSDDGQMKEIVISHFMNKFAKLSEDELSGIQKQLLQGFSPDDTYPFGAPLFMDTPRPCSPLARMEFQAFNEVMAYDALTDEEAFPEASGSQSDRKSSLSTNTLDVLSVNQLLDSVLETARQVASFPVSSVPIPYDQMKNQCEALVTGKQQKMSVLRSFKSQQEAKSIVPVESEKKLPSLPNMGMDHPEGDLRSVTTDQVRGKDQLVICSRAYAQTSFKLPPSSPYDKFMRAAGC